MSFLHENGWFLFLITEGITWIFVGLFFYSRYWLRYDRLSQLWLMLIIIVNAFQILLGVIDFYFTGEISFFQIVIVLFFTYASTLGSSDFQKLDQFIKRKLDIHRKRIDRFDDQEAFDRHLPYRITLFLAHTTAFYVDAWSLVSTR